MANSKKKNKNRNIALTLLAIAVIAFLAYPKQTPNEQGINTTTPSYTNPIVINVNNQNPTPTTIPINNCPNNIAQTYHNTIDPVYPTAISTLQTNCGLFMGTWQETNTNMGCTNIPIWDTNQCFSTQINALEIVCHNMIGTTWVCDSHNIRCYC